MPNRDKTGPDGKGRRRGFGSCSSRKSNDNTTTYDYANKPGNLNKKRQEGIIEQTV